MNRAEWYSQRRIYRAALRVAFRNDVYRGMDWSESSELLHKLLDAAHGSTPVAIQDAQYTPKHTLNFGTSGAIAMACNVRHLTNSYPRTDVRNRF